MLKISSVQIKNSTDLQRNFEAIWNFLSTFSSDQVDLVLFPECSLSGFSAAMKECTPEVLEPYLKQIEVWSEKTQIDVVLPTAWVDSKIYNSGFVFANGKRAQFFKLGLTESEKKFFSTPDCETSKVFHCKGYSYGVLVCMEAQQEPWKYFSSEDVDFILWPGYWGWKLEDQWQSQINDSTENLVYSNMLHWKKPLIQANFSQNDFGEAKDGPQGLSIIVNSDNNISQRGEHLKESFLTLTITKNSHHNKQTYVL